jgi:hypothetical protein
MQVHEVCLEGLRILGPRHLVDAWRSGLLQTEETPAQNIHVNVMQERRQLALSAPGDGFSYAGLRL